MTCRPRLAVDMDEVIADAFSAQLAWYCATHNYRWTADMLEDHHFSDLADPAHTAMMENMLHEGQFFRTLPVMTGAQQALRHLQSRYDIFITTAAMEYPASCAAKFAWLQEHFPFISPLNIVFCGDKSILAADYLVDDNVRHFRNFSGQGILFSAPHNKTTNWTPRVTNWKDATTLLENLHDTNA